MKKTFISAVTPPGNILEPALWFAFSGNKLLVYDDDRSELVPQLPDFSELGLASIRQQYLGRLDGQHCFSVELAEDIEAPPSMTFQGLRRLYTRLDDDFMALAGRAVQIVDWDRTHQFCGRCGAKTETIAAERGKQCSACGLIHYPRLSPSIIVRVRRRNEILLARNANWARDWYSVIAGFVEPGETLEEAVAREVMEEVNIRVKNIEYFGSQPWPFPNSLMLGFTADYAGGEICPDRNEIQDAGWYTIDNFPSTPSPRVSISGRLIAAFVKEVSAA